MANRSNLRDKLEALATVEALEGSGPNGLDESFARLSVVKLELERLARILKDQEARVSMCEREKALLEERIVREDDSKLWEQEAKDRDAWSLSNLRSLGKPTIRSLGADYDRARANISKWRKTARAEDSKRLRKVIPLLIHHIERLDRLTQEHRKWAHELEELQQRIELAKPSSSVEEMRHDIATSLERIRSEALGCIAGSQVEEFDKWFKKLGLDVSQGISGQTAASNWKKTKVSAGRFRDLHGTPDNLAANEDTNTVVGAFELFVQLKNEL